MSISSLTSAFELGQLGLARGLCGLQRGLGGDLGGGILAPLAGLGDRLGGGVSLRTGGFHPAQQLASLRIQRQELVDAVGGASPGESLANAVGIGADQALVNHDRESTNAGWRVSPRPARSRIVTKLFNVTQRPNEGC